MNKEDLYLPYEVLNRKNILRLLNTDWKGFVFTPYT
jgi:hypothetical protein